MRFASVTLFAATAIILACSGGAAGGGMGSGSPADETAIRDLATRYADAFNKRDAKALAAMTDSSYEDVDPMGRHTQGRAAVESTMTEQFKQIPPGMTMSATTVYVKWINPSNAVIGGTYQMAGGPPGMPNKGAFMGVVTKHDSSWVMISSLGGDDITPLMPKADTVKH